MGAGLLALALRAADARFFARTKEMDKEFPTVEDQVIQK